MFINKDFNFILNDFYNSKNSHSYIFYTNDFFACKEDVTFLFKSIFNVENLDFVSSDLIIIEKNNNKNILKDDIVKIKNMFQNTSYLNNKRIYLIEEAHKLNSNSANIILKFLEEPLNGIVAFFITTNLDAVISTIKSRCQIINCFYENSSSIENFSENILEDILKENKFASMWNIKEKLKKYDRNMLINIFYNYLLNAYEKINVEQNLELIKKMNKAIGMLNNNVNVDFVYDYLFLEGND